METKQFINYEELTNDTSLLKIANGIREEMAKVLPVGKIKYKLCGLKTKKSTWSYGATKTQNVKPATVSIPEPKALNQMSDKQKAYFGNMNNLSKLDGLKNVKAFGVVKDPIVKENWMLILIEKTKDSLGRIIEIKNGIIFRPFTEEEEAEYQAKLDKEEAEELGMSEESYDLLINPEF